MVKLKKPIKKFCEASYPGLWFLCNGRRVVWVKELPSVLWRINTTPNRSTGYTPFFMVYGAEVVLPSDIRHDSHRVTTYVEADNEKARQDSLDLFR